jgi:hypothetical protein
MVITNSCDCIGLQFHNRPKPSRSIKGKFFNNENAKTSDQASLHSSGSLLQCTGVTIIHHQTYAAPPVSHKKLRSSSADEASNCCNGAGALRNMFQIKKSAFRLIQSTVITVIGCCSCSLQYEVETCASLVIQFVTAVSGSEPHGFNCRFNCRKFKKMLF